MTKRHHSSALTGLVLGAVLMILPAAASLARQEEKPAQDAARQSQNQETTAQPAAPAATETQAPPAAAVPATPPARRPPESTHPPRTGKFVGDHWTPYEPPSAESFPQGSQVHIIEKGDTLWDLAGKFLENPFLWPQIWDVNQYITDSHWIYPGDPLLIPGKPTVIGEKGPEPPVEAIEPAAPQAAPGQPEVVPAVQPEPIASVPAPIVPMGPVLGTVAGESDIYCSNYIVDSFTTPELRIREREDGSRTILSTGDIVFLNHGMDANVSAGDEYTVLLNEGIVPHPIFSEDVGESVRMMGRLRVIAVQENGATAEIVQACDGIEVGMPLVPYEEIPLPITTPAAFRRYGVELQTENAGYIVDDTPDKNNIGNGDIVNVDLGSDNGLRPGDILTVFREWGGTVRFDSTESYIAGAQVRAEKARARGTMKSGEIAQSILGQVVVLRTEKHTAMAKVILSVREISLGDRVAQR